jgi:hypothetical protein
MWLFVSQLRKYSIEPHDVIITWSSIEYFLHWETNYHMRFYWVLPQLRDKLSHEVLLSTSSTERQIITWGSIEYFLNWEKNYHIMRFYWVLPQLRDKLSHGVLLSTSSTERQIITWGYIEYFLNWETNYHPHVIICLSVEEVLNRTSWCDNLSLSWGSTQ